MIPTGNFPFLIPKISTPVLIGLLIVWTGPSVPFGELALVLAVEFLHGEVFLLVDVTDGETGAFKDEGGFF